MYIFLIFQIQSIYKRHQSELEELTAKTNKYNEELSVYEDIELAKQNLQQQEIELDSRVKTLSSTLKSTLLAVTEAQNRKAELEVCYFCFYFPVICNPHIILIRI